MQLKRIVCLPLQDLSMRKVAALLWGSADVVASIMNFDFLDPNPNARENAWQESIEEKIKEKVSKLQICVSLCKRLDEIISPMSKDVKRWIVGHESIFNLWDPDSPPDVTKLRWTEAGTIDNRKTAKEFVRSDVLHVVPSYLLACLYCLEDDIPRLWERLPEDRKRFYSDHKPTEPHLEFYWPHALKGDLSRLDYMVKRSGRNNRTLHQLIFEYSAENGHRTAAEYFSRKLTNEERDESLMRSIHAVVDELENDHPLERVRRKEKEPFHSVLFYLLSLMTPPQLEEILDSRAVPIMLKFLDWPWHDLFSENAGLFWKFFPPVHYEVLFARMIYLYEEPGYYLPRLFREMFEHCPPDLKQCFLMDEGHSANIFLEQCLDCEDLNTVALIFRSLDAADRVKVLSRFHVLRCFWRFALLDKWRLVQACLREAALPDEDERRWKQTFVQFLKKQKGWEKLHLERYSEFLGCQC